MLSFCEFDENVTVKGIREIFCDDDKSKSIIDKYRKEKVGIFDSIMAILLRGPQQGEKYQQNYCKNAYNKEKNDPSTWSRNAVSWTTNKKSARELQNFAENEIKESDTLRVVLDKMKAWDKWDTERKDKVIQYFENTDFGGDTISMSKSSEGLTNNIGRLIREGGCRQIIFTGAPGTGKTYIAKEIAKQIGKTLKQSKDGNEIKYEFVQFHPSYDYTDFVEGLRPIQNGTDISFAKVDGIFKKFCRNVVTLNEEQPDKNALYFFIIDEINRANLSKVFGELMYGLEKDKRGEKNRFKTQYHNLPTYDFDKAANINKEEDAFADGFYIPENVVIIGTMNDIDRSVDSMDFALRRRFEWKEFIVDDELLLAAFETETYGKAIMDNAGPLCGCIMSLNAYIHENGNRYGLNRHYDISQGQFANIPQSLEDVDQIIEYVWNYRIESLLREYLRGEDDIDSFIKGAAEAFKSRV